MYESGTILKLKVPRDPDPETEQEFPYNIVEVIGRSPVNHGIKPGAEWTGADGEGVIIVPRASFGGNLDEPFGKLVALYDVESLPEPITVEQNQKVRIIDSSTAAAGKTPEEVFASEAPGKAPEEGQIRARTSPLDDPRPNPSDGPLGPAPTPEDNRASAEAARVDTGSVTLTEQE